MGNMLAATVIAIFFILVTFKVVAKPDHPKETHDVQSWPSGSCRP